MSEIKCNFDYMYGHYRCHIDKQKLTEGQIIIKGSHVDGKTNKDVKWLDFSDCNFINFPRNLQDFFPNIISLRIDCSKLEKISREDFRKWKNLVYFRIENCGLKCLKGDIFRDLKDLWHISFKNNEIKEIEPEIIDGLTKLKHLDFRGNVNIDLWYDAGIKSNTLSEIKKEIKDKCKPKSDETNKIQKLEEKIEKMSIDIEKLKEENLRLNLLMEIVVAESSFKEFTINVGKTSFKIDKILFASQSTRLAEIFRDYPEAKEFKLEDTSEKTFQNVFDFICTNEIPENANLIELFVAANRLKIHTLIKAVAEILIENIDESNSFEILVIANRFNHDKLREKAFENIKTKIFPFKSLDENLAKQPEKLRNMIEMKRKIDQEFENLK
ncbi:hypothetical protein PVAND_016284 [Polypedilum vanderplanki]|uniref:BTB domain-containing protein n=1 Tax=Polypedilum vanderplanki TaxID=319348 RepID=A0A9J6BF00_POLVA|nr:hypothetical protein PVAND_016284 [Polypedilum vanderplanki]